MMSSVIAEGLKSVASYKSALIGAAIILMLVGISVYTVVAIPYDEAVRLWRAGEQTWIEAPRNAYPTWYSYLLQKRLPETIIKDSSKPELGVNKVIVPAGETIKVLRIEMSFTFDYDDIPSEINIFYTVRYNKSAPQITMTWLKPDGTEIELRKFNPGSDGAYYLSVDSSLASREVERLVNKLGRRPSYELTPTISLFAVEDQSILERETVSVMKGVYRLSVEGLLLDPQSDFDVKLVVYGKVYGWAGTDHLRRDIGIALLWGTPIALTFGLIASVSIALIQMAIGAISAWFGGVVDNFIQRVTEVFIVLPFLPTLIMVSTLYKIDIWTILLVVIILLSFGPGVKNYRAVFLQLKESQYIEAAKAFGAGAPRIILLHLVPRVIPTMIPAIVYSVADFVFLEAALAILGIGDPRTPTWGKVIEDSFYGGALFKGLYYWTLQPAFLLLITSLSFALVGLTLDKIFNPRLREV
uniref:Peptide/nickel transport system permease protein n=2 Tax=Caldiarchaeum subterraneum TaxID=311458 RepID=E6N2Z4_CALS0|nr:peptide/nickel transport system permease protein [Candidatus Caldarchaeum subterraneum]